MCGAKDVKKTNGGRFVLSLGYLGVIFLLNMMGLLG